jgi:hypothetical protein
MKRKAILTALAIIGLAALAFQTSSAQAPTGSITNVINDSTNILWDFSLLSGLQQINMDIVTGSHGKTNDVQVSFADPFIQDAKGKFVGAGTNPVTIMRLQVITTNTMVNNTNIMVSTTNILDHTTNDMAVLTKGSASGADRIDRFTFTAKATGEAMLQGQLRKVSASKTFTIGLSAITHVLFGRASQTVSAAGLGSVSDHFVIGPLPLFEFGLGDGSWTLVLNFAAPGTDPNKLTGDATVTLGTGLSFPYSFTGAYAPHTGQSKLNLKGHDAGLGSTIQVTLQATNVIRIVGRVSGQTIHVK